MATTALNAPRGPAESIQGDLEVRNNDPDNKIFVTTDPTPRRHDYKPRGPALTFLDLPPEIRNEIYRLSLRASPCHTCFRLATPHYDPDFSSYRCKRCNPEPPKEGRRPRAESVTKSHDNEDAFVHVNRKYPSYMYPERLLELKRRGVDTTASTLGITQPALTRVCRKVREETLPMWYGNQHFYFTIIQRTQHWTPYKDDETMYEWLRMIGPKNAAMIRSLFVIIDWERSGSLAKLIPGRLHQLGVDTHDTVLTMLQEERECADWALEQVIRAVENPDIVDRPWRTAREEGVDPRDYFEALPFLDVELSDEEVGTSQPNSQQSFRRYSPASNEEKDTTRKLGEQVEDELAAKVSV